MKLDNFKYLILLALLIIIGCSSSQSSVYKPPDGGTAWKVNVIKKDGITSEFICSVNGTDVVSASFPLIGDNFEKTGEYKGKKVMMNGYRKSTTSKDASGNTVSNDSYQIRVFIDDTEVDKFDF